MRKLYLPKRVFIVTDKNNERHYYQSNCKLTYKEIDEHTYSKEMTIDYFVTNYSNYIYKDSKLFTKRKYFRFKNEHKYFYYDDVKLIETFIKYDEAHSYYTINDIANKLDYEEYLQFIFDKEHELKQILLNKGE